MLAALDVASDEGGDREVLFGQLCLLAWAGVVTVVYRCASRASAISGPEPAAGITFHVAACSR